MMFIYKYHNSVIEDLNWPVCKNYHLYILRLLICISKLINIMKNVFLFVFRLAYQKDQIFSCIKNGTMGCNDFTKQLAQSFAEEIINNMARYCEKGGFLSWNGCILNQWVYVFECHIYPFGHGKMEPELIINSTHACIPIVFLDNLWHNRDF